MLSKCLICRNQEGIHTHTESKIIDLDKSNILGGNQDIWIWTLHLKCLVFDKSNILEGYQRRASKMFWFWQIKLFEPESMTYAFEPCNQTDWFLTNPKQIEGRPWKFVETLLSVSILGFNLGRLKLSFLVWTFDVGKNFKRVVFDARINTL